MVSNIRFALTRNPMQIVWRYIFALLGGGIGFGLYTFLSFWI